MLFFRFVDFVALDNDVAGIEYIQADSQKSPWGGAMIKDSIIVGHSKLRDVGSYDVRTSDQSNCTGAGQFQHFRDENFLISNTSPSSLPLL